MILYLHGFRSSPKSFKASLLAREMEQRGLQGFLDAVLNQRFVDDRQHFLGHGFGGREKARAVAGGWKQAFLDHGNPCNCTAKSAAQSNQAAWALQ